MNTARNRSAAGAVRRRFHRARTVAAIVVLLGFPAAGLACTAHDTAPRAGASAVRPTRSAARSAPGAAGPGATSLAGLAGVRWTDFYGIELPVSRSGGPHEIRGGLAWGFADSPLGALLAAVNIGVRANAQWGPGIFGPTIRHQVSGPGASALLAACEVSYDSASRSQGVPAGSPLGPVDVAEAAFRWVRYSASNATVDIVSVGPGDQGSTTRAATRVELEWSGGDWRVLAPPGGDWGNSAVPLTSLAGYTVFPAPSR